MATKMQENTRSVKRRSSKTNCCVVDCNNTYANTNCEVIFYNFPNRPWQKDQRDRWIAAVKRKRPDGSTWEPTKHSVICSEHFIGNKKSSHPITAGYVPSLFPKQYRKKPLPHSSISRNRRYVERATINESKIGALSSSCCEPMITDDYPDIENPGQLQNAHILEVGTQTPPEFEVKSEFGPGFLFCSREDLSVEIQTSLSVTKNVQTCTESITSKNCSSGDFQPSLNFSGYASIQHAADKNEAYSSLCGVSPNVFSLLLNMVRSVNSHKNEMSIENKLVLFLMRLKLGITFSALAAISGLHRSTVSRCFFKILDRLNEAMKGWIFWPSKTAIQKTMPLSFKLHYPNCRAIIDCTEMKTERPPTIQQQNFLYSTYKSGYTLKYYIAISPNGMVTFLSSGYGGRASDCFITTDSGFINKLEPEDVILAEKGFPSIIIDAKKKECCNSMPPFALGDILFSEKEMNDTYHIASVRIHVERLIQRIKTFNFLNNRITVQMIPHMDKVMMVCANLSNLQNPIIKTKTNENVGLFQ